jgi:arylformamidase
VTDLEREYSPSSRVGGDAGPFVADYERRSEVALRSVGARVRELPGGSLVVPGGPGAPILVFIHGGYWQALSARASMYLAPPVLSLGWSYVAVEYPLAPGAALAEMVEHCIAELVAARESIARESIVEGPLVLAGHSAGAHLAAMVSLVRDPPVPVSRTVLVSGVYDLRPLVQTSVNDALGLDLAAADAMSPALRPVVARHSVTVAWGDDDTDAFRAQGATYAARLRLAGLEVSELECVGRHHFDIVDDLVDPATALGALTLGGL